MLLFYIIAMMAYNRFDQWDLKNDFEKAKEKKAKKIVKVYGDGIAAQMGIKPPPVHQNQTRLARKRITIENTIFGDKSLKRKKGIQDEFFQSKMAEENLPMRNSSRLKISTQFEKLPLPSHSALSSIKTDQKHEKLRVKSRVKSHSISSKRGNMRELDKSIESTTASLSERKMDRVEKWINSHFSEFDVFQTKHDDVKAQHVVQDKHLTADESCLSSSSILQNEAQLKTVDHASKVHLSYKEVNTGMKGKTLNLEPQEAFSLRADENSDHQTNLLLTQPMQANSNSEQREIAKAIMSPEDQSKHNQLVQKTSKRIRPASFVLQITKASISIQTDITGPIFDKLCERDSIEKEMEISKIEALSKVPLFHKFRIDLGNDQFLSRTDKPLFDMKKNDLTTWLNAISDNYSPKVVNSQDNECNCFITLTSRFKIMQRNSMEYVELLPEFPGEKAECNEEDPPRIFNIIQKDFYRRLLVQEMVENIPELVITRIYKSSVS